MKLDSKTVTFQNVLSIRLPSDWLNPFLIKYFKASFVFTNFQFLALPHVQNA